MCQNVHAEEDSDEDLDQTGIIFRRWCTNGFSSSYSVSYKVYSFLINNVGLSCAFFQLLAAATRPPLTVPALAAPTPTVVTGTKYQGSVTPDTTAADRVAKYTDDPTLI